MIRTEQRTLDIFMMKKTYQPAAHRRNPAGDGGVILRSGHRGDSFQFESMPGHFLRILALCITALHHRCFLGTDLLC
jgi:hypothetical protein